MKRLGQWMEKIIETIFHRRVLEADNRRKLAIKAVCEGLEGDVRLTLATDPEPKTNGNGHSQNKRRA